MTEEDYNKIKANTKLLKDKEIKSIVEELLSGYELISERDLTFAKDSDKITMSLEKENCLIFEKTSSSNLQIQIVDKDLTVTEITYEIRPKGIIVSKVTKAYDYSRFSQEKKHVVDLFSESYVLTCDTIKNKYPKIIADGSYDIKTLSQIIDITSLNELAALVTNFETHIKKRPPEGNKVLGPFYKNITYLNGEDVSQIYDRVEGLDQCLRIYDLYRGIINLRNINDIFYINTGVLRSEAFHLKEFKGIVNRENNLVSSNISLSEYYEKYKTLLKRISPSGEVSLESRADLLASIRIHRCDRYELEDQIDITMFLPKPAGKVLKKIIKLLDKTR